MLGLYIELFFTFVNLVLRHFISYFWTTLRHCVLSGETLRRAFSTSKEMFLYKYNQHPEWQSTSTSWSLCTFKLIFKAIIDKCFFKVSISHFKLEIEPTTCPVNNYRHVPLGFNNKCYLQKFIFQFKLLIHLKCFWNNLI